MTNVISSLQMQAAVHHTHQMFIQRRRGLVMVQQVKLIYLKFLLAKWMNCKKPIPKSISILTGAIWMDELIQNPNPASFYKNMGITVPTFMKLQALLEEHGVLYNSQHVSSTKKLGTLLYMLITGLSNRKYQQQFQRSASTILGYVTLIGSLSCVMICY
jgi:hypothetical protein